MDTDEWFTPKKEAALPRKLEGLAATELTEYIAQLEAEIARVKEQLTRKDSVKNAAEAIFKKEKSNA